MQVQLLEDRQLLSGATGGQAATPRQDEHDLPSDPVVICCDDVACEGNHADAHTDTTSTNGGMTGMTNDASSQADYQSLIDLIETVELDDEDTADDETHDSPSRRTLSLITSQTQSVHEEIADLLSQLRRIQDLQVTIEVRFITIQDRFFERIGVDFDFDVNDTIGGPIDNGLFDQSTTNDPPAGNGGNQPGNSSDNDDSSEEDTDQGSGFGGGINIEQPFQGTISVNTTVTVPDGGTVLLGGIKRLREGRNQAGVPILNKIPYVNRLFRNTGIGRETQRLMMMVTPRIIIQE